MKRYMKAGNVDQAHRHHHHVYFVQRGTQKEVHKVQGKCPGARMDAGHAAHAAASEGSNVQTAPGPVARELVHEGRGDVRPVEPNVHPPEVVAHDQQDVRLDPTVAVRRACRGSTVSDSGWGHGRRGSRRRRAAAAVVVVAVVHGGATTIVLLLRPCAAEVRVDQRNEPSLGSRELRLTRHTRVGPRKVVRRALVERRGGPRHGRQVVQLAPDLVLSACTSVRFQGGSYAGCSLGFRHKIKENNLFLLLSLSFFFCALSYPTWPQAARRPSPATGSAATSRRARCSP